jgi:hypothetical protein
MAVIVMTNQLCILNFLEGNSVISTVFNANEFVYQNFYIQPPKSASDSSNPYSFVSFCYQGTVAFFDSIRSQSQTDDEQGSLFHCDKIIHYHTNQPSSWRRESLFWYLCY